MMKKRPHSVTIISGMFMAAGVIGLAYHATEFTAQGVFQYDLLWVSLVRLLAIVGAAFLFRGKNWARWLLVIWTAYHVVLSALHSGSEFLMHSLLLAVITYFLFRKKSSAYFRGETDVDAIAPDSVTK